MDMDIETRPMIRIAIGDYTSVAERAEQAILTAGLPVYIGSGQNRLVYPVVRRAVVIELVPITMPMMRMFMDQAARFEKIDWRQGGLRHVAPPRNIARLMLSRNGFWPYPLFTTNVEMKLLADAKRQTGGER
jgi:hypothetical protein